MGWERQQRCSGSPQVEATPATSTATIRGGRPTLAAANEALKEKLAILQEENNVLRVQVGKTECDYAQHTEANHGKVVQALTDELRETAVQLSKLQGAEKRYERLVGELEAQHEEKVRSLTAELEQRDVRLVEAAESAERKLASAVAVKVRMIESRDEKLRQLHTLARRRRRSDSTMSARSLSRSALRCRLCVTRGCRPSARSAAGWEGSRR